MATATTSLLYDTSTDANFRAWGSWISTQLAAMGWVQTADTGQINWTTVLHTVSTNTAQGYEIWRMADSLQSTAPVYMKIEYGTGISANCPAIWVTIGTATNGAGTLTGSTTTRQQLNCPNSSTTTSLPCYMSGSTNRLGLAMFVSSSVISGFFFSVERSKDSTGADTGAAVTIVLTYDVNGTLPFTCKQQTLPAGGGAAPAQETAILGVMTTNTNATYGLSTGVSPIFPFLGQFMNPLRDTLVAKTTDITFLSTASLSPYGTSHTYLFLGSTSGSNAYQGITVGGSNTNSFFMRYD